MGKNINVGIPTKKYIHYRVKVLQENYISDLGVGGSLNVMHKHENLRGAIAPFHITPNHSQTQPSENDIRNK